MIFGRSTFLNKINIIDLLNLKFTTIGINKVDNINFNYVTFVDKLIYKKRELKSFNVNAKSIIITRSINKVRSPYIYYDTMNWCFTHDYILEWLKTQKNVKNVILIGAADFENKEHYNTTELFNPQQSNIDTSIKRIESITEYKVYKLNPNGILNIPTITAEELKQWAIMKTQ